MEDTEIVNLFFARSEGAIAETQRKYDGYLRTIASRLLPKDEDAEEILNDVYLTAWNTIPPKKPEILKFYLSRVVRNLCFKRLEYLTAGKRDCGGEALLSELEDCIPDDRLGPEQALEAKILGQCLNRFLAGLGEKDAALFVSRYYYGMNARELAQKYGSTVRSVKYRLEKLRGELRQQLSKEGIMV